MQLFILRVVWWGHQFSYSNTEPEMGHCRVQICLSLRNGLRLPDQFWQVTDSLQEKHICDKGQAEVTYVSENPLILATRSQVIDNSGIWMWLVFFLNVASEKPRCSFFQIHSCLLLISSVVKWQVTLIWMLKCSWSFCHFVYEFAHTWLT